MLFGDLIAWWNTAYSSSLLPQMRHVAPSSTLSCSTLVHSFLLSLFTGAFSRFHFRSFIPFSPPSHRINMQLSIFKFIPGSSLVLISSHRIVFGISDRSISHHDSSRHTPCYLFFFLFSNRTPNAVPCLPQSDHLMVCNVPGSLDRNCADPPPERHLSVDPLPSHHVCSFSR